MSVNTINKYFKISNLPPNIIQQLDSNDKKITLETALNLSKALNKQPKLKDKVNDIADALMTLNSDSKRKKAIQELIKSPNKKPKTIVDNISKEGHGQKTKTNNKRENKTENPWIPDENGEPMIIPSYTYTDVRSLVLIKIKEHSGKD